MWFQGDTFNVVQHASTTKQIVLIREPAFRKMQDYGPVLRIIAGTTLNNPDEV
jgi:hypothetical protein